MWEKEGTVGTSGELGVEANCERRRTIIRAKKTVRENLKLKMEIRILRIVKRIVGENEETGELSVTVGRTRTCRRAVNYGRKGYCGRSKG